ncbi:MAG: fasciclin domain-containing protein [Anaerolineae bacterium]|nr:fasciclin domain-containing protein [Anaerolineae bacterium]
MKLRQVGIVLCVLVCLVVGCGADSGDGDSSNAQAAASGSAYVRVGCMLLPFADISMDGAVVWENMVYPYISDYELVSAGAHTLQVTATDGGAGPEASIDLDLEADHRYLIVSYGNIAMQSDHALLVVDETEVVNGLAEDHASILFVHMLSGTPGLDGYIDGALLGENLTYGTAGFFETPTGEFQVAITPTGLPDMVMYEDTYNGLSQTYSVVAMLGTPFNPKIYMNVYTTLDMLSFFNHLADVGGYYDETRDLLTSAGVIEELAGPGPLTVFAPWDSVYIDPAFRDIPDVRDDPTRLTEAMRYYIVPENVPPYVLYHRTELLTLQGTPLLITSQQRANPERPEMRLNGGARAYQDYRTSNGVLYEFGGLVTPFEK